MQLPVNYTKLHYTQRKVVRNEYIKRQDGKCYHCKKPLSGKPSDSEIALLVRPELFPKNFFNYPVHLHHNHDTGMTIGAVHAHCNAVLWQYYGE